MYGCDVFYLFVNKYYQNAQKYLLFICRKMKLSTKLRFEKSISKPGLRYFLSNYIAKRSLIFSYINNMKLRKTVFTLFIQKLKFLKNFVKMKFLHTTLQFSSYIVNQCVTFLCINNIKFQYE